ncbi:MAG: amidohydrolase family protein [Candidatus Binatia bacterium]
MASLADFRFVSADSHVNEPPELFAERMPKKLRDRAPRVEEVNGVACLIIEGMRPRKLPQGRIALAGEDLERAGAGGWDPEIRLRDQDRDGVAAEVVFPSLSLQSSFSTPDPELQMALSHAYNDWAAEIFAPHADRFAVAGIVPMLDIERACGEAERVRRLGLRALLLPARVEPRPYNHRDYDRFWRLAEELGLPLTFHAGTGHEPRIESGPGGAVINYLLGAQIDGPHVLLYFATAGILDRFPRLRIITVETGCSWLAWVMTQMDEIYAKHHMWATPKLTLPPSEFVRRQCHVTFQNDPVGIANRGVTGVGCLLWGSDYPHHEGTWPNSHAVVEAQLGGVPDDEKRMILGGTAARIFGFDAGRR